ncbi:DUF6228 family protein [Catellatospora coxensis]|uniref:Uncharacterized protein n=1 Tax=Catellatospora coxensis TaxID=310354 RepID=A0A8J3P9Z6_9ACTN|nr:DUF6228 family protein [Catellatospora coxensis]GIG09034.1 hypothetical protein Cco03nite_57340 [Catellatospora coxensis]
MSEPIDVHFPPSPAQWTLRAPVDPWGDGYVARVHVEIHDSGLRAETEAALSVPPDGGEWDLVAYVQGLADGWQGWSGPRTWRSLDDDLRLDAVHDGRGRVTLGVTLRPKRDEGWQARIVLVVEAGEQLDRLAQDLRSHLVL